MDQDSEHTSEPAGLVRLLEHMDHHRSKASGGGVILLAHSEAQAARLARAAACLFPDLQPVLLPGWDCLPFDRIGPSRAVMGQRMRAVRAITSGATRLVITSAEAAAQRLPADPGGGLTLAVGVQICPATLRADLERLGYGTEEDASQPGEMACRGAVMDLVPADGGAALRIRLAGDAPDCTIAALDRFDPETQRSLEPVGQQAVGPASELLFRADQDPADRTPGLEHRLPELGGTLASVFDLMPDARLLLDPEAADRLVAHLAQVADARTTRVALCRAAGGALPANGLYMSPAEWKAACAAHRAEIVAWPAGCRLPLRGNGRPAADGKTLVAKALASGSRIGVSGERAARALGGTSPPVAGWSALLAMPPGSTALLPDGLAEGFATDAAMVLGAGDVLPPRHGRADQCGLFGVALRPGDAVIHLEYGMARLDGIETVSSPQGGRASDCLVLGFAGGARKLVDCAEMDRVWRYGAGADGVALDRADGAVWSRRRETVLKALDHTARGLLAQAEARAETPAPALRPARRMMARFASGFAFTPTPDQDAAFADIAADLARPHPIDRLLCGDVGFGKTEAALRAAAAAALCGKQVAILAPTTVLVRQHLSTFTRRFAAMDLEVAALSRLTPAAEARSVRARLADGSLKVVIGTQSLAARDVAFADLALVVIDEEQRFGTRAKAALATLRTSLGGGVHTLTMTATPIPRTLQGALAGLQTISVLTTPPARRQPVRTTVLAMDEAVLKTALQREHARGGQSFCVCPRIEDLDDLARTLKRLVPKLSVVVLHGRMKPDAIDRALVGFAEGHGDVLLATDIIEAGLDIPRANTILVFRAAQFGLAQLHQLRGRVGRSRVRGMAWLFTDPEAPASPGAARRLAALSAHDGLGAGFAVAAADLDQRGAGDLLGEEQAGHAKLLGVELARHLLAQAMARLRGEPVEKRRLEVLLDLPAFVPAAYMPDAAARIALHARLARSPDTAALAEELEDRFGALPAEVAHLLAVAELRETCRSLGIARLEAGPEAVAADFIGTVPAVEELEQKGQRLLLRGHTMSAEARLHAAERMVKLVRAG